MESFPRQPNRRSFEAADETEEKPFFLSRKERPVRTPKAYKVCDWISEGLIYFMVVFSPWAFGATQDWAIWTLNIAAYLLGAVLLAKWILRASTGYKPARWGDDEEEAGGKRPILFSRILTWSLAILTILFLAYGVISAVNARASFEHRQRIFDYKDDYVRWLPHSYDAASTWESLAMYLGWACFFWAARDWLLGKSPSERRRASGKDGEEDEEGLGGEGAARGRLPERVRRLLWVVCINGSLLALESILQRLSKTNALLFMVEPKSPMGSAGSFGPYAYRSNAATYFNMVWPLCFAFWLTLRSDEKSVRRSRRVGSGSHIVLLPGAILMAACPIISTSRGGALVSIAAMIGAAGILYLSTRREHKWFRAGILGILAATFLVGGILGGKQLAGRMENILSDRMSNRKEIYENAAPLTQDFPIFGTGAGTFGWVYQLYRGPEQVWAAYLHDDWLELRITFGWAGFSIILAALLAALLHWPAGRGFANRWEMAAFIGIAIAGCLFHAKYDFPFRIYSLVLMFLLLCALLVSSQRPRRSR